LLQLPSLELQAHIRELLETNVMLEAEEESDATASFEALGAGPNDRESPVGGDEAPMAAGDSDGDSDSRADSEGPSVEIVEDSWNETSAASGEAPWNADDEDRQQDYQDGRGETLQQHLQWQIEMAKLGERERAIGRAIVDAINDDGYLTEPFDAIAATLQARDPGQRRGRSRARCCMVVQTLDPLGIGARPLSANASCCSSRAAGSRHAEGLADAAKRDRRAAISISSPGVMLSHAQARACRRRTKKPSTRGLVLVRSCHPRPGTQISSVPRNTWSRTCSCAARERGWTVEINPAPLPRVRINEGYASLIGRSAGHATMRTQLQEARWLLKSLEIRNDTLLKVARSIVERQLAFLDQGDEHMRPMILKDIAEAIEMHESTISRVTSGKYMHTPRGVFELRYFFSSQVEGQDGSGTSSTAIRAKIRKLIKEEDPDSSRCPTAASPRCCRRKASPWRAAPSPSTASPWGIAPSNERKQGPDRP
jgi:RNA polymerase sigma-54 factor